MNTFCGANVLVEISGMSVMECVAIQYSASESKRPIYGYSSRHFDAVAAGQVFIQGNLVINYVHQDYLFRLIQIAKGELGPEVNQDEIAAQQLSANILRGDRVSQEATAALIGDFTQESGLTEAFKTAYWDNQLEQASQVTQHYNAFDLLGSVDIRVTFGERSAANQYLGKNNVLLSDVFFTGRGTAIEISEDVIVEQYPFFARNIHSILRNPRDSVVIPESEISVIG